MKRAEHRLSSTWQLLNGMQKQLRVLTALQRELGIECPATATVWAMLRACLSMRSDMAHFCSNLQVCSLCDMLYTLRVVLWHAPSVMLACSITLCLKYWRAPGPSCRQNWTLPVC